MKQALAVLVVLGLAVSGVLADDFYLNRDNGINYDTAYDNQGAVSDVRTAKWGCKEAYIMDLDTAAILSFMGGNPISDYTFTLYIMPSSGWPATPAAVGVQTINSNTDWAEGNDTSRFNSFGWTEGTAAATSEYAQTYWKDVGGTPTLDTPLCVAWQLEDGTPQSAFRDMPANFTNSVSLSGSSSDHGSYISVVLDQNLVNDLLNNAKNRGLRMHRNLGDNMQNYTREASVGQRPYLEVVYSGGGPGPDIDFYQVTSDRGEEITTIKLRVVLSATSGQTVTVNYAATGGTAQGGGVDYTLSPGQLQFSPGETTKFITVAINDDGGEDPDETIVVTLSSPVNGQLGTNTTHTFTILDDDRTGTTWNVSTYAQLRTACQLCLPCDEIIIAPGTYYLDSVYLQLNSHHVIIRGSTGNPDDVVICGHGMNVDQEPYEGLIVGDDSITVMDLTVKSMWGYGIHVRIPLDVDDAWINNVVTLNIGERHIKGSNGPGVSDDVIIENSYMLQTEARQTRPGHPVDPDNYIGGIDCMATNGWIIRDNIAEGIVGATGGGRGAIFLWNGVEDVTIERNRFFDCATGISIGNASGPTDSHVHPWHSVGGIIRNNFILCGSFLGLELCNTKDMKVYNNTVYTPNASYFRTLHIYDEPGEGLTTNLDIVNNIIRGKILDNSTGDWSKAAVIAMGNIVDDAGTQVTSDWFVNVATGDFHLTANATDATDQGTVLPDVTDDFDKEARGAQPDLGADEYQGVVLPVVTLSATDANAAEEGQDTGTFTFTRDQTSGNLTVNYSVAGSAEAADYEETLTGSVTILDGQASANITITPVDDSEVEGAETVQLTLTADPGYQIGSPSSGTVTIADNDTGGPTTLFSDDFESGNLTAGGWTAAGGASAGGQAAYSGSYGAKLKGIASITKPLSTSGYTDIHVKFWGKAKGMDSGEYLYCEWSDDGGLHWYELGKTQSTSWAHHDLTCPAGAANNPNFQVRFRSNADKASEYGCVDEVEVVGTSQ